MNLSRHPLAVLATSLTLLLAGCSSNDDGSDADTAASVTTPTILGQPASVVMSSTGNAVLSVVANGAGGTIPSYQWYRDGAPIADATAAVYVATAAGTYYVVISDSTGTVSSANASVTVTDAPQITGGPLSATILTGTRQRLAIEASGAGLAYQWYKDGAAIEGATGPTYDASAEGVYQVVVTNPAGAVASATAAITVSATLAAPAITTQPAALTVNSATSATFKVATSGTSVAYQWYRDGTAIAGATGASYTIPVTTANDAGAYTVSVSNTAGSSTSSAATLTVNVLAAGTNTAAVVNAANAFLATLSDTQKTVAASNDSATTVLFDYTLDNAIRWTNLPGSRHGLRLNSGTLTAAQLSAANALVAQALSATGIDMLNELRAADEVLANAPASGADTGTGTGAPPDGVPPVGAGTPPVGDTGVGLGGAGGAAGTGGAGAPGGYGAAQYSIAFIGTPSRSAPWMLHLVGHHLAYNITYNTGKVSATPTFLGVEPPNWSVDASGAVNVTAAATTPGTQHAPLEKQRKAAYDLAESLYADSASAAAAKLPTTFTDVIMGASGNADGNFKSLSYPTTARGLQYSAMNASQKAYVRAAIAAWVNTQAPDVAASLLASYLSEEALANTYVAYGVGQNGVKADFSAFPNAANAASAPLDAQHSYLRIDGPRVWIECMVQQGILYRQNVHYHTIWRDKTADYGGSF